MRHDRRALDPLDWTCCRRHEKAKRHERIGRGQIAVAAPLIDISSNDHDPLGRDYSRTFDGWIGFESKTELFRELRDIPELHQRKRIALFRKMRSECREGQRTNWSGPKCGFEGRIQFGDRGKLKKIDQTRWVDGQRSRGSEIESAADSPAVFAECFIGDVGYISQLLLGSFQTRDVRKIG